MCEFEPPTMPERVAIIVAMEHEIRPLVRDWRRVPLSGLPAWQWKDMLVVCGGIGAGPARAAAELALAAHKPDLLVSAGFAGSLCADLRVPTVVTPALIVDSNSGREFTTDARPSAERESFRLVTLDSIAGAISKPALARRFRAHLADMEAAAVADLAERHGTTFLAIKAISEELEFPLPPLQPFIDAAGRFRTIRFLAYVAPQPWLWRSVLNLRRNTSLAATALCHVLHSFEAEVEAGRTRATTNP